MREQKWISKIIACFMLCCVITPVLSQSIILDDFKSNSLKTGWKWIGKKKTGGWQNYSTHFEKGALRLTPESKNHKAHLVWNKPIQSNLGLNLEFDFKAVNKEVSAADGFSVFFVDGTVEDVTPGGDGGVLGYASKGEDSQYGVPHGYVGIGFDEFGNFSSRHSYDEVYGIGILSKGKRTPIYYNSCIDEYKGRSNAVAIRGSGNGLHGYPVIAYKELKDFRKNLINGTKWRRARVLLDKDMHVTVMMQFEEDGAGATDYPMGGTRWLTVLDNVDLSCYSDQVDLPATLKLGFAASTGGEASEHWIDNINTRYQSGLDITANEVESCKNDESTVKFWVTNHGVADAENVKCKFSMPNLLGFTWKAFYSGSTTSDFSGVFSKVGGNTTASQLVDLGMNESIRFEISGSYPGGNEVSITGSVIPPTGYDDENMSNNTAVGKIKPSNSGAVTGPSDMQQCEGSLAAYSVPKYTPCADPDNKVPLNFKSGLAIGDELVVGDWPVVYSKNIDGVLRKHEFVIHVVASPKPIGIFFNE